MPEPTTQIIADKDKKVRKKNWKTTAAGILAAVGVLATQLGALLDDDPTTKMDTSAILAALGILGVSFLARDKDVSSKSSGVE